jgi:hypothetical protein
MIITLILWILAMVLEPEVWGPFTDLAVLISGLAGIILGFFGLFVIAPSMKFDKPLEHFFECFYPLWFKVKFEMLPTTSEDLDKQIMAKLTELHPEFSKAKVTFDAEVLGKTGSHRFNIYAEFGARLAAIRRFEGQSPTTMAELVEFKADVMDVARRRGRGPFVILAVSKAGFEADAVEWTRSEEGLPTKNVFNALLTHSDGKFTSIWVR